MNFYSIYIEELQFKMNLVSAFFHSNLTFQWNIELENLFKLFKTITRDVTLVYPNTNHPIFNTVETSFIGKDRVLFQMNNKGQLDSILYNSRILRTTEQKFYTIHKEVTGIVYSFTTNEHLSLFLIISAAF